MINGLKALGIFGLGAVIASLVIYEAPSGSQAATVLAPVVSTLKTEQEPIQEIEVESEVVIPVEKEKPNYVPVSEREKPVVVPKTKPVEVVPVETSNCHPGYSGCLRQNAGDYDCAGGSGNGPNYTGAVQVYGSDPFGLDRDNDGWGCD